MAPRSLTIALGGALALAAALPRAEAVIQQFKDEPLLSNFLVYSRNAMYPSPEADTGVIDIKLDLDFPELGRDNVLVQVSVFPIEAYERIGLTEKQPDGSTLQLYCCTPEMAAEGRLCNRPNSLIVDEKAQNIAVWDVEPEDDDVTRFRHKYEIAEKAITYVVISNCNSELTEGTIMVNGHLHWVNPFGELPGEVFGFLAFYKYMSMAYLACAAGWAILCARAWREIIPLQNWCTLVIFFGLLEVYLRYMEFHHFNETGARSKGILLSSVFFLCVKKTLSRVLVLVVSLGFGLLKPTLASTTARIGYLAAAYFFFSGVQLTVENLSHHHGLTFSEYLLMLPVIFLDFMFAYWIFSSLSHIIRGLESRQQETKLNLYRKFNRVLIVCFLLGIIWTFVFVYCILTDFAVTNWEDFYKLEIFWDVQYFVVLLMILYLWAPSSNSLRFAYERVDFDDEDDEGSYDADLEDKLPTKFTKI